METVGNIASNTIENNMANDLKQVLLPSTLAQNRPPPTEFKLNTNEALDGHKHSYILFQLKLSVCVFIFWIVFFFLINHKQKLFDMRKNVFNFLFANLINTPKLARLKNYARKLFKFLFFIRDFLRSLTQTISKITYKIIKLPQHHKKSIIG